MRRLLVIVVPGPVGWVGGPCDPSDNVVVFRVLGLLMSGLGILGLIMIPNPVSRVGGPRDPPNYVVMVGIVLLRLSSGIMFPNPVGRIGGPRDPPNHIIMIRVLSVVSSLLMGWLLSLVLHLVVLTEGSTVNLTEECYEEQSIEECQFSHV